MATDTRLVNTAISSDPTFRDVIAAMRAQFLAAGLVQTADTGQIDPATVARPASSSIAAGYEIWRFNDALQATLPVFIKVEYGTGGGASNTNFGWWLTVGTITNGAGVLSGQVSARRQMLMGVTGNVNWYCSGTMGADGGRFNQMANYNPVNANWAIYTCIERTRDSNGVATADGIVFMAMCNGTSGAGGTFMQHLPATGLVPTGHAGFGSLHLPTLGGGPGLASFKSIVGLNVGLTPAMVVLGKLLFGTSLFFTPADIGDLSVITLNEFGVAHNFICFGAGANFQAVFLTANFGIALRWE